MKTIRQQVMDCLSRGPMSGIEISRMVGIRENEVYMHLPHIERSLSSKNKKLILHPPQCLSCDYIFKERRRYTRPSRCPMCKSTHLQAPTYEISDQ